MSYAEIDPPSTTRRSLASLSRTASRSRARRRRLDRAGRRQGRPLRLGQRRRSRCSGRRPRCGSRAARSRRRASPDSRAAPRRGWGGPGRPRLRDCERGIEHAVDEAHDRARRLEPEDRGRRLARGLVAAVVDLRLQPADERDERGALRDGGAARDRPPARSVRTTFSRKSERMSRTCSTGAASQARASFFPLAVAAKRTRWGPRPPRSMPGQRGSAWPVRAGRGRGRRSAG